MSSTLGRSAPSTSSLPPAKRQKKRSSTLSSSAPPLGKFLASSDKSTRDKAVASLSRFLSAGRLNHLGPLAAAQAGDEDLQDDAEEEELPVGDLNWDDEYEVDSRLAPLEMAKLWKGIYYCYWMSDKPLVQQALAQNLADLTLDVRPRSKTRNGRVERFRSALAFLRGFWEAIVREWSTLDHHRLDKFLLLIRRFTHVGFRLLEREQWDARAIDEYNAMLTGPGGPLDVTNDKVPISLAYHLFDIYLDEIERLVTPSDQDAASESDRSLPLLPLLGPMYTTAARAPLQIMFTRLVDNVFTPLLDALLPPKPEPRAKRRRGAAGRAKDPAYPGIRASAVEGTGVEDPSAAAEVVGKQVLKRLFEEGGQEETGETQRRRIYTFVTARDVDFEE
ncbi:hypothetical protein BMF94_0147 [Rhodotorula taiwanensis]|uniref:Nop52-domain-containing protein n=1 Tax=Rhodotorula taiwanensis TaxID=741276 RepID=A0A2S5BJE4_9BASI|nr:hypothetical protein BMF94_0147 [Rhodotorula taiwanensis]